MSSAVPELQLPFLPPNTIVPSPVSMEDIYIQYFNRLYEDIALSVNARDFVAFTIPISTTATNIPNLPNFGAFFIAIAGISSGMPSGTWALAKSDQNANGIGLAGITLQSGTGATWGGVNLVITSTATNYQIAHTGTVTGSFKIRIAGTQ